MSSPLFTQSFLDENELRLRSQSRSAMKRRGHKQRIRRGHESVQGSVDADHATVSGGVIRPGSASSATAPRSSLEAATPTEPGHGPTTPTGVVPRTPPFPARSGGGERHGQIHKVKKLSVTIVMNVTVSYRLIFYAKVMELIIHQISSQHSTSMRKIHQQRDQAPRFA